MSGARVRVLVVDDSPLFRRYLSRALESIPDIEVVGTAADGDDALRKIRSEKPDLVTLDVEMPGKDGLATLREIQSQKLPTRVMMLSASGGERRTVEALCLGAEDFLVKPTGQDCQQRLRDLLLSKLMQFGRVPVGVIASPLTRRDTTLRGLAGRVVEMLVIGISTGGPNALAEMLPCLPHPLPVPVVIVQHMPPLFTGMLAERLDSKCRASVREAREGTLLEAGGIYIAPGDHHLTVGGTPLNPLARLNREPQENGCRPAVDVLFRSAARMFKGGCLAVVMTGMGKDGLEGTRAIVEAGGYALAQDQESSVVWGMPKFVVEAGLANEVHSLARLGSRLSEILLRR